MNEAAPPGVKTATAPIDDVSLTRLVAHGDVRAFETLYHHYYPRLSRFLTQMTRRRQLVEEVINDTLFVVWQKANTYNGNSKVATWIFAIAYRKAMKALSRLDDAVEVNPDAVISDVAAEPDNQLLQQQLSASLRRAMNHLSMEHRSVIELTYYHGLAYAEIAEIMDSPVDTVKTRMFHARRKLKALLGGTEQDWL
jgi:RNA polymerase sigma factor (sigma-70 family)